MIHATAAWANTPEKIKFFVEWIEHVIKDRLPCEECREHMTKYLKENSPGDAENMFTWSWKFHNAVNSRLGKGEMSIEEAQGLYLKGGVLKCNEGCGGKKGSSQPSKAAKTIVPRRNK